MSHHMLNMPHTFVPQLPPKAHLCAICSSTASHEIHNMKTRMKAHTFTPRKQSPNFCADCGLGHNHPLHDTMPQSVQEQAAQEQAVQPYIRALPGVRLAMERELTMLDLNGNEIVEVQICSNPVGGGETLWINVDGICRLRAVRPGQIVINDERKPK
jgi:hypothetical protein